jgi:DNA end-binding protein Ku
MAATEPAARSARSSASGPELKMAPRPYWKGYLKLSLVTCPVSLTPATTEGEKVRFHTLNSETGHRVRSRYVDAETGKPVADEDEVKGYEVEDGRHVIIEDEEFDAVGLESTRTIDIDQFVPAATIDWIWYDKPYYLMPDDEVAQEAFAVIREAMAATGTVGISRLVLARRERAVMLQPRGKGIILWTLRYGDEVRDPEEVFGAVEETKTESKLLALVEKLIADLTRPWDPSMVTDPVQDRLKEIIAAKQKKAGRKPAKAKKSEEPETPSNVVSIMDALKKSIAQEKKKSR